MKTTLTIDTTKQDIIEVSILHDNVLYTRNAPSHIAKAQAVLPLIEDLMTSLHLAPKDIDTIEVKHGEGSFTGIRVAFAIANTLGWLLAIPVNGTKGGLATPEYNEKK